MSQLQQSARFIDEIRRKLIFPSKAVSFHCTVMCKACFTLYKHVPLFIKHQVSTAKGYCRYGLAHKGARSFFILLVVLI